MERTKGIFKALKMKISRELHKKTLLKRLPALAIHKKAYLRGGEMAKLSANVKIDISFRHFIHNGTLMQW